MLALAGGPGAPQEASPAPAVHEVAGKLVPGTLLTHIAPDYPEVARHAHITGTVVMKVIIDKEGKVGDVQVVSSPSQMLTQPAVDAVRKWRYTPWLLNGVPTRVQTTISLSFDQKR